MVLLLTLTFLAQINSVFTPPPQDLVKLSGGVDSSGRGIVNATIEKGWHIQSAHPLDTFTIPTSLAIDGLNSADYPQHTLESFTFSSGSKVAVYDGTIQIPFTAKVPAGAKSVKATLHYQACNDTVCLPPKSVSADIAVGGAPPPPAASQSFTPLSSAPHDRLTSAFLTLEVIPVLYTVWRSRQLLAAERRNVPIAEVVGAPPSWAAK